MTIGKKLYACFGAALALGLGVSVLALIDVDNLGGMNDKVVNVTAKKRFLSGDINMEMSSILAAERGVLLRAYMKDKATMAQYHQDFQDRSAEAKTMLEEFKALCETAEDRGAAQEMEDALNSISQGHAELWNQVSADQIDAASETYKTKTNPAIKKVVKTAGAFTAQQGKLMLQGAEEARTSVRSARWMLALAGMFALLVAVVIVFVVRQINQRLRKAILELGEGAEQVAGAAGQVSSSSQSQAQASSEQAASLEETSSAATEINSMARQNSDNSLAAAELVSQSQQKFEQTNQSLDRMVGAMAEINSQSDKISKIIKVIDEIAFQTNILALNAAVEAARAGEAGMGFAVVADEVRSLAQRSAQAAKDTASLIEESIGKSNEGKATVDQVTIAIRSITEESIRVKTLVDEVSQGSQEQVRGIDKISASITQMERVTQSAAASSEQGAAAAEELNAQSQALKNVVEQLTSMVGAG
jgi:methyl-accepting chemotaxis protein/methyl-accepting chemotaxis protein-1 (serine sensor receptor)